MLNFPITDDSSVQTRKKGRKSNIWEHGIEIRFKKACVIMFEYQIFHTKMKVIKAQSGKGNNVNTAINFHQILHV